MIWTRRDIRSPDDELVVVLNKVLFLSSRSHHENSNDTKINLQGSHVN